MIGPLGRLGAAVTLGQHCPQMTQRRCRAMRGGEREGDLKCFTDLLHAAALVSHALCHGISSASLE